jgi:hypothetical protein
MKPESNLSKLWLGLRVLVRSTILSTIIILLFTIRLLIHSRYGDHYSYTMGN